MDKGTGSNHYDAPWMQADVMPAPNRQLLRYIGSPSGRPAVPADRDALVEAAELPHGSDFP